MSEVQIKIYTLQKFFNIFLTVTIKQIKQTIHKLLNDKVLKSNNILNKAFKTATLFIKNDFV